MLELSKSFYKTVCTILICFCLLLFVRIVLPYKLNDEENKKQLLSSIGVSQDLSKEFNFIETKNPLILYIYGIGNKDFKETVGRYIKFSKHFKPLIILNGNRTKETQKLDFIHEYTHLINDKENYILSDKIRRISDSCKAYYQTFGYESNGMEIMRNGEKIDKTNFDNSIGQDFKKTFTCSMLKDVEDNFMRNYDFKNKDKDYYDELVAFFSSEILKYGSLNSDFFYDKDLHYVFLNYFTFSKIGI